MTSDDIPASRPQWPASDDSADATQLIKLGAHRMPHVRGPDQTGRNARRLGMPRPDVRVVRAGAVTAITARVAA